MTMSAFSWIFWWSEISRSSPTTFLESAFEMADWLIPSCWAAVL